ncbi:MAG TPA: protease pro-enzyme activation domain-containing protein [Terracidiphilus sp.]|nr:protease pro-enzyme activation domain-containing protein [Terracidiphilus sp.]
MKPLTAVLLLALAGLTGSALCAQSGTGTASATNTQSLATLRDHHPAWANPQDEIGPLAPDSPISGLTLVLSRTAEKEAEFKKFLAEQQNPASPQYHHWLTPAEVGERFGPSQQELNSITNWLWSQGLQVKWIAPSGMFVGFGGKAADVNRAFHTELKSYRVHGLQRMSVASEPMIPATIASMVKSVHGLYTIENHPYHHLAARETVNPNLTISNGVNFITPGDFKTIYDGVVSTSGSQQTIGIVGRARTDFDDFNNFQRLTNTPFQSPTEVVPTAFGGVDPGPAYTSPPPTGTDLGEQSEATLDVMRAGSVAPNANLLLVVATSASGGIAADTQYLVQTTPLPAQIITISFGACESAAGQAGVNFWDTLFQQAAAEGISVFVSSGDSGASGCEQAFTTPLPTPPAVSPNYICSSSYATCVGGTEFNDTSNPGQYWTTSNGSNLASALSYIPEGGWNEPLTQNGSPIIAGSGGGVSGFIATPDWQTGPGVPGARAGRYTPDLSFSSSCHDGYFACMAASGGSCVAGSNGSIPFIAFCGTSAAAPSMAGVAALLDEKMQYPQGNMNPEIYAMAANSPSAFHDATPATSGVATCDINTPSMCNNSTPGTNGLSGGQAGYPLTTGFDLVTGVGSPDVLNFMNNFGTALPLPTVTVTPSSTNITALDSLTITVTLDGGSGQPTPTGQVQLTSFSYNPDPIALSNGTATFTIPGGTLAGDTGVTLFTVRYLPDSTSNSTYGPATGTCTVSITTVMPTIVTTYVPANPSTAQDIQATVTVSGPSGAPTPAGTLDFNSLVSGANYGATGTLSAGSITFTIPAGVLPPGTDQMTTVYIPDLQSARIYSENNVSSFVTVTAGPITTPTVNLSFNPSTISLTDSGSVIVNVVPAAGGVTPTGTVQVNDGLHTTSLSLSGGTASSVFPPGELPVGNDTFTATYSGDNNNTSATGSGTLTVTKGTATVMLNTDFGGGGIYVDQSMTVLVRIESPVVPAPTGSVTVSSGNFTSQAVTLTGQNASVTVPGGTLDVGTDTLTVQYSGDNNYNPATGSISVYVAAGPPSFTIAGTDVTISTPGATSGNTSTITVTPANGFTGSVTLKAQLASKPVSGVYAPTLSFGSTSPVSITSANAGTATLTITTTAATQSALKLPARQGTPWLPAGSATLAFLAVLWIPKRRRILRTFSGMLTLLIVLACGVSACGGGSSGGGSGNSIAGTTPGTYTVQVTGTSGTTTSTGSFTITVN